MASHALGRVSHALQQRTNRPASFAQHRSYSRRSNFNQYIAQRPKQAYLPRGTAVIPRETRPPPSPYELTPLLRDSVRRKETILQIQKLHRMPLETWDEEPLMSQVRMPGDEMMPRAVLRRLDASVFPNDEAVTDDDMEGEEDPELISAPVEDGRDLFLQEYESRLKERGEHILTSEEADEAEAFAAQLVANDPNTTEAQEAVAIAKSARARSDALERKLKGIHNDGLDEPREQLSTITKEELEDAPEIPVPNKEKLSLREAHELISNTWTALHRDPDMYAFVQENEALKLSRDPVGEAMAVGEETVTNILQAGYDDYTDVDAPTIDHLVTERIMKKEVHEELRDILPNYDDLMKQVELVNEKMEPLLSEITLESIGQGDTYERQQAEERLEQAVEELAQPSTPQREWYRYMTTHEPDLDDLAVESAKIARGAEEQRIMEEQQIEKELEELEEKEALEPEAEEKKEEVVTRPSRRSLLLGEDEDVVVEKEKHQEMDDREESVMPEEDDEQDDIYADEDEELEQGQGIEPAAEADGLVQRARKAIRVDKIDGDEEVDEADYDEDGVGRPRHAQPKQPTQATPFDDVEFTEPEEMIAKIGDLPDDQMLTFKGENATRLSELIAAVAQKHINKEDEQEELAQVAEEEDVHADNVTRNREINAVHLSRALHNAKYLGSGPLAGTSEALKEQLHDLKYRELSELLQLGGGVQHVARATLAWYIDEMTKRNEEDAKRMEKDMLPAAEALTAEMPLPITGADAAPGDWIDDDSQLEAKYENAIMGGDIQRAAAVAMKMQRMHQEDVMERFEKHLEKVGAEMTEEDIKKGRRQHLLIRESMDALLKPGSVPKDNPVAKFMRHRGEPGYEDLEQDMYLWAKDFNDPKDNAEYETKGWHAQATQKVERDMFGMLRSLVARGHLPLADAKEMAIDPFDYLFRHAAPRKTELLLKYYVDGMRPGLADARERGYASVHTATEIQSMLHDAIISLKSTMTTLDNKRLIAKGLANDLDDVNAVLASQSRLNASKDEMLSLSSHLFDILAKWNAPEDEVIYTPTDMLFAPQEQYRVPTVWEEHMPRPEKYKPEGHITKGRIRFRRKGENEYMRFARWREDAFYFVQQRLHRDRYRKQLGSAHIKQ